MPQFVVTDENGITHLVEASNQAEAVVGTPKGISARIAQQFDIERFARDNEEKD